MVEIEALILNLNQKYFAISKRRGRYHRNTIMKLSFKWTMGTRELSRHNDKRPEFHPKRSSNIQWNSFFIISRIFVRDLIFCKPIIIILVRFKVLTVSHSFCSGWISMNPSYLNGPLHEVAKRFRPTREIIIKLVQWEHFPSLSEGILILRFVYCYIHYLWSKPDGPRFMVNLWMLILDRLFGRLYSLNQNPICRSPNHSSVLSKNQNIG